MLIEERESATFQAHFRLLAEEVGVNREQQRRRVCTIEASSPLKSDLQAWPSSAVWKEERMNSAPSSILKRRT